MAGPLLARLIPRCTDPVIIIRQTAVDCVQCVLKIAAQFEGIFLTCGVNTASSELIRSSQFVGK